MPATRTVELPGGLSVTVRELTVAEVRAWAVEADSGQRPIDIGGEYAFEGYSLDDLMHLCDGKLADLERLTPSELAPLAQACRDLNPHFFRARDAMAAAQRAMLRGILTAPSSPSSKGVTA